MIRNRFLVLEGKQFAGVAAFEAFVAANGKENGR
jgi:hypothetical protein